ncbi:MAG: DUF748 domain-containing protein, partial [Rhodoferax sp.]|nr:DUF748 domain-containing protein [Rhodoferax sp.]
VRDQLTADIWEELNRLYLYLHSQKAREDWETSPFDFLHQVKSSSLTLQGLTLAAAQAAPLAEPQFRVERLVLDLALASLWRGAPVLDGLVIEAPDLRWTHQGGGRHDLDDVLQRLAGGAPSDPAAPPPAFAVHNIQVTGGRIDLRDAPTGRTHTVRDLQLGVPFISTIASDREVLVQPRLSLRLNGSRLDTQGQGTPLASSGRSGLTFRLDALDLAPWLPYLPDSLPVRPRSATLGADLQLDFERGPANRLRLRGRVELSGLALDGPPGPSTGLERLRVELADLRPLERVAHLASVELDQPQLALLRQRNGEIGLAAQRLVDAPEKIANNPDKTREKPQKSSENSGWQLTLDRLVVRGGALDWEDRSTRPAARARLQDLSLEAQSLAWPLSRPAPLRVQGTLAGTPARLSLQGQVAATQAELRTELEGLPLSALQPYLAAFLVPPLDGRLGLTARLDWQAGGGARASRSAVEVQRLVLDQVRLGRAAAPLARLGRLELQQGRVDLLQRSVRLGRVLLQAPELDVARGPDGRWMVQDWLVPMASPQPAPTRASPQSRRTRGEAPPPAWKLALGELSLRGGRVAYTDRLPPTPVQFTLEQAALRVQDLTSQGTGSSPLQGELRLRAGQGDAGSLSWRGRVWLAGPSPGIDTELQAQDVPLQAFMPYLSDRLQLDLLRADAGFRGRLSARLQGGGLALQVTGDTSLEDVQAHTRPPALAGSAPADLRLGEELLRWKVLSLRGLDLSLRPQQALQLALRETVLSDFYARIALDEAGRLNVQDLVRGDAAPAASANAGATAPSSASVGAASGPGVSAGTAAPVASAQAPDIRLGPVSLTGGTVDFSDRFIRPNYAARLTELTGALGAFSSQPRAGEPELAEVSLRGRVQGTGTLDLSGRINPLVRPLSLDLQARVRELELPPLSPYSARYAGYGIERGKLSVDLRYRVQPDGRLEADNSIVLNQLTFGDRVEGSSANLPVKLAVALLSDRHGVIDINLPVSGSLNDPDFKLGPIVVKLIVNLVVKAVTAPFSLLARALGGGDEASQVAFAPGSAALDEAARASLDRVATALTDRPALQLTVVGQAGLETEREALRQQQLQDLMRAERRRAAVLTGATPPTATASGAAGAPAQDEPALTPDEEAEWLPAVYRRADIPKPREANGALRTLPPAEMRALLLSHLDASDEALRALALRRSVAVRDHLAQRQIAPQRLFLGAARTVAPEGSWRPHAELTLSLP